MDIEQTTLETMIRTILIPKQLAGTRNPTRIGEEWTISTWAVQARQKWNTGQLVRPRAIRREVERRSVGKHFRCLFDEWDL